MKNTTVLVTGGTGFIGSHLVNRLLEDGHKVVVLDNLSSGKRERVNPQADFRAIDVCDPGILKVFEEVRPVCVFHYAAQVDIGVSQEQPQYDAQTNVVGSVNVANAARRTGVQKIVFASSAAVYGDVAEFPTSEDHTLDPPFPYGIAKLTTERYLQYFYRAWGLEFAALRFANVYGPGQSAKGEAGVVAAFATRMPQGIPPVIYGSGQQTRDFVFVKDVVEASIAAMRSKATGAYNIGTGVETSINDLFSLMRAQLQSDVEAQRESGKQGGQERSCLAIAKAKEELGWSPMYTLEEGIKETLEWYKEGLTQSFESVR